MSEDHMRVLFAAPPSVGLLGRRGAVYTLMRLYERALLARGHEVEWLDPWGTPVWEQFDVAHLFRAGGESVQLGERLSRELPLAVSPIQGRVRPAVYLRGAVWLDRLPGLQSELGRAAALCGRADRLALTCEREGEHVARGLGARTPAEVLLAPVEVPPRAAGPRMAPGRLAAWSARPFMLFLGDAGDPRENALGLVEAARGLASRQANSAELLLAGPLTSGETARRLAKLIARTSGVEHEGCLSPEERDWALAHARALVLPARSEGAGLDAARAAVHGATVVVPRHGGAAEYLGPAAHYVDPRRVNDLRDGLRRALTQPLDAREHLRRNRGTDRAGRALERFYGKTIAAGRERLASARTSTASPAEPRGLTAAA